MNRFTARLPTYFHRNLFVQKRLFAPASVSKDDKVFRTLFSQYAETDPNGTPVVKTKQFKENR
eukprot:UN07547